MATFLRSRGRALPYLLFGNVLPIGIATATAFGSHHTVFFVGAAIACVAPFGVTYISRRNPIPFYLAAYGGLIGLTMMQAYSGGAGSGYAVLMMMAMVWFGVQASDRELVIGLGVLAACSYLPMLLFSPEAYPLTWGHATLLVLIGTSVAGSLRTVTRGMVELSERLRREAVVDDLTGLLNRRGWRQTAETELARANRANTPVALVAIDLDDLKEINDSLGHDEGDRVLSETAERMRSAMRPGDTLARIGGDEFVALLCGVHLDEVLSIAERLRARTPPRDTFSAGIAARNPGESLDDLLRRSDFALYSAKATGRSRLEVAPAELAPSVAPVAAPDRAGL